MKSYTQKNKSIIFREKIREGNRSANIHSITHFEEFLRKGKSLFPLWKPKQPWVGQESKKPVGSYWFILLNWVEFSFFVYVIIPLIEFSKNWRILPFFHLFKHTKNIYLPKPQTSYSCKQFLSTGSVPLVQQNKVYSFPERYLWTPVPWQYQKHIYLQPKVKAK